jgi:hypothetical protein
MFKINNKVMMLSIVTATALLVGCGSSETGDASTSSVSTVSAPISTIDGQLIDGYVKDAKYSCADGTEGLTDINGRFSCETLPVTFSIGSMKLGEINSLAADKHVFPQDLCGVARDDINNTEVVAMAQLLQSLDTDGDPENGIDIDETAINEITAQSFNSDDLDAYLTQANVSVVSESDAIAHLEQNQHRVEEISQTNIPVTVVESVNTVKYELSDDVKNTLAYMGNEERLAYDTYMKLHSYFPDIKQLENIPLNSEVQHIAAVKALVTKYDINDSSLSVVDSLTPSLTPDATQESVAGVYGIKAIQDLYDMLIAKGAQSEVDALQVGCMVEVVDVTDLDKDIAIAEAAGAEDVVSTFNFLRDGSYSHYWSFDSGLKSMGVENGCCSLGDEYCKTEAEYPQQEKGGNGNGGGNGHSQQMM